MEGGVVAYYQNVKRSVTPVNFTIGIAHCDNFGRVTQVEDTEQKVADVCDTTQKADEWLGLGFSGSYGDINVKCKG